MLNYFKIIQLLIKKYLRKKIYLKERLGIFEIKDNKINHILNFYKVEDKKFKKIF